MEAYWCFFQKESMGSTLVCVKRVKQEASEEWDESMPLPGDIIEGFAEDDADEFFVLIKAKSEHRSPLGKISQQAERMWLKVRRGDSTLACVVQERSSMLKRGFTIKAANDDRHVAVLGDLTLEKCSKLCGRLPQEKSRSSSTTVQIQQGIRLWFLPEVGEIMLEMTPAPGETQFGLDIKRTSEGLIYVYSVATDSAAERAGLRQPYEEANKNCHLVVLSRLEGKSLMPSSVCSAGLINCTDQNDIEDTFTSAIEQMDSVDVHLGAWPNQTDPSNTKATAVEASSLL